MWKKFPLLTLGIWKLVFIFLMTTHSVYALVSMENLLLGDFSQQYKKQITDPLYYVFRDINREKSRGKYEGIEQQKFLKFVLYRGMIDEGHNLNNQCKRRDDLTYPTPNELQTAKRIYLASLQYLMLDLSTDYMASYAQYFDFTEDQYIHLVDNLMGNYCSKNLTTISLKQLRQNILNRFQKKGRFELPSIEDDPFFPQKLQRVNNLPEARKQEFAWTLEIFKSACSWANEVDNARLLVPLAKNPVIASGLIRELVGKGLAWDKKKEEVIKVDVDQSLKITCKNMICRKTEEIDFNKDVPRAVGSKDISSDFERLYCHYFRDLDYVIKNQEPKIEKQIKQMTFDEQNLMTGQMVAMMSGYPDFFVQAKKYSDLMSFMRAPMDKSWDQWATEQNSKYKTVMTYEESMRINLVNSDLYFQKILPEFSVELDINQGEFDRAVNILGKLKIKLELDISKKFLTWVRNHWKKIDVKKEPKKVERIKIPFRLRLADTFDELNQKFPIVPWKEKVTELVIDELIRQVAIYEGNYFNKNNEGIVSIPIHINFSPFALRHMRYRYLIRKNETGEESDLKKLKNLSSRL
jgi:hypothetical protein